MIFLDGMIARMKESAAALHFANLPVIKPTSSFGNNCALSRRVNEGEDSVTGSERGRPREEEVKDCQPTSPLAGCEGRTRFGIQGAWVE